jgi:hypothetical protein
MKKMMKVLAAAVLFTVLAIGASASDVEKNDAIKKLLDVTQTSKLTMSVVDTLLMQFRAAFPAVPDEFWDEAKKEFSEAGKLEELVIPIYSKYYTLEEINAIIDFYNTPTGKKMIETMPAVMQESMAAGQAWGMEIAKRISTKLKEKGFEN